MAQKIADWLQNHKMSSHVIAAAVLGFFGLYTSNQAFADYLNGLLIHYPKLVAGLGSAALIYLRYSQSAKAKP